MIDWITLVSSNCFSQVILGLHYNNPPEGEADLFSRCCVDSFDEKDLETYGYQFTQIFEENVLNEIIVLNGLATEAVYSVRYGQGEGIERLRSLMSSVDGLSEPALANTISALVSISRFRTALPLLEQLRRRTHDVRGTFELGWLEFLVSNRFADGRGSSSAFERMRLASESGGVPAGRILDLCTQGVVWYLKRREVDDVTFRWCLATGTRLARRPDQVDFAAISSWFRGLAMLPASIRNVGSTREYMTHSRVAAIRSIAEGGCPRTLNALKTYYESSIKEYLYVNPSRDLALEAAKSLITLDPAWAPSYGECGEIYAKFGEYDLAANCYEKAAALGPPYFGHHLLMAARCWAEAGETDLASQHYSSLINFAPDDVTLRAEAAKIGSRASMHNARESRGLSNANLQEFDNLPRHGHSLPNHNQDAERISQRKA